MPNREPLSCLFHDPSPHSRSLAHLLEAYGFDPVVEVSDPESLTSAASETRPELIFTAAETIVKTPKLCAELNESGCCPVIALVSDDSSLLIEQAVACGAAAHLSRTADAEDLRRTIRVARRRHAHTRKLESINEALRNELAVTTQVQEKLGRELTVGAALTELSASLIDTSSMELISRRVLRYAKMLTTSQFGYVGYIEPPTGHMLSLTMTHDIWNECRVPNKTYVFKKYAGLWGWVLKNRQPLLTNDPSRDPRSTGTPEGHLPIRRFISVPALIGDRLKGQIALANATRDYTEQDLDALERLAAICAVAMQRQEMEDELKNHQADLEAQVALRTNELFESNQRLRLEVEERKRAQKELKAAYTEIDQIFQTTAGGMRVVDLDFNVVRANDTLARLTGRPKEELTGSKCYETFPGEHCHRESCSLDRIRRGELIVEEEVSKHDEAGRTFPCLLQAKPFFDDDGRIVGMVEDFRDIEEQKRLESIAEAVATMKSIGYVFSGIRHELGNPINNMKTLLTVLKKGLERSKPSEIEETIDTVLEEIGRVEFLLRSLRTFNMFESPEVEIIRLEPFLGRLLNLAGDDFDKRGIAVDVDLDANAAWVLADPRALQQVLLNLLANSADALEEIDQASITIATKPTGRLIEISVEDNGKGMTSTEIRNLFKPLFTTKPNGTGLGLLMVRKLLAKMDGTVKLVSEPGRGTTATITLPRSRERTR
jgi:PAS domain S-box-containing protein